MAEQKGKLVTCNRCGATYFCKFVETAYTDGGYTSYDKYEELPEDWLYETQFGHLCSDCAYEFRSFITSFMNGKVCSNWKDPNYIPFKEESE